MWACKQPHNGMGISTATCRGVYSYVLDMF